MKIAVVLESTGLAFRPALREAERLGAAGVQADAAGDLLPDRLTATGRREVRHLLRSHGLEFSAVHCPLRHGLEEAHNQQPRVEHVRKVMSLAFDLGPRLVVVPCPRVPADPATPEAARLREALTDLGRHADKTGVRLALEIGLDPGEKVAEYLAGFDTGGLAVNYDPANLLLNGYDPLASLGALLGRVAHVHARDARRSGVSRSAAEAALGAGDIDWLALVGTLGAAEYRGFLAVERETGTDRLGDIRGGVAFLRRLVG